jgi:hypothetical protein
MLLFLHGGWIDLLERNLEQCRTASTWFSDQKQLDTLYEAIKPHPGLKLPRPSTFRLTQLIEEGEVLLKRLREIQEERAGSKKE